MLAITASVARVRPGELQELLAMEKSTVSRNVRDHVGHRWLTRIDDPKGRGYSLEITEGGAQEAHRRPSHLAASQEEAAELLRPEMFDALKLVGDSLLAASELHIDIGEHQRVPSMPRAVAAPS